MRKSNKSRLGALLAVFVAATLTVPAVSAAAAESIPEAVTVPVPEAVSEAVSGAMSDAPDLSKLPKLNEPTTTDISVEGTVNAASLGELSINAELQTIVDPVKKAVSVKGLAGTSGLAYEFSGYADSESVMMKLPGLATVLSYNFTTDPSNSALAEILGPELMTAIHSIMGLASSMSDPEAMKKYQDEVNAIVEKAVSSVEVKQLPAKDCVVGDGTVSCQGVGVEITQDLIKEITSAAMDVTLPNGQTFREYGEMLIALTDDELTMDEALEAALLDFPEKMNLVGYMNGNYPAEIVMSIEDSELRFAICGPQETPWQLVRIYADDEEIATVETTVNEQGIKVVTSIEGQEYVASEIVFGESGFTATVSAQGQVVATYEMDFKAGTFSASSILLPEPITGSFSIDENGLTIEYNYAGLKVTQRTYAGGTVEKPEGTVLELSTVTMEELEEIANALSSAFGGALAGAA